VEIDSIFVVFLQKYGLPESEYLGLEPKRKVQVIKTFEDFRAAQYSSSTQYGRFSQVCFCTYGNSDGCCKTNGQNDLCSELEDQERIVAPTFTELWSEIYV
jgi:hypothetical protein